jgi:SHS2 domain-containing protein
MPLHMLAEEEDDVGLTAEGQYRRELAEAVESSTYDAEQRAEERIKVKTSYQQLYRQLKGTG